MVRFNADWLRPSTKLCLGLVFLCATVVGCRPPAEHAIGTAVNGPPATPQTAAPQQTIESTQTPIEAALKTKIKFKTGGGDTAFSLKPQKDGGKLVDGAEKELARFNLDGVKLKIKDADDVVLGYVVASDGQFKIKNANQSEELWELQRQDDGDWKLKDGNETLVYKIKAREYGFEIENADEKSLFKVKLKDGKTSLRDASENTVYSTRDAIPTIAVACLGLEKIDQLAVRSALMTMLTIRQGR